MRVLTPARKRQCCRWLGWLIWPTVVLIWVTRGSTPSLWVLLSWVGVYLLINLVWWRCDACGRRLAPVYNPRFCQDCGHALR